MIRVLAYKFPSYEATATEYFHEIVQQQNGHTIMATWELDATVAKLLKGTDADTCRKLYETKRAAWDDIKLFYIPGKLFAVEGREYYVNMYDLSQYFPDENESQSATLLQSKVDELMDALKTMNLYPKKLTSPIAIFKECILDHTDLPAWDTPEECMGYAMDCADSTWVESFVCGYLPEAHYYDLASAFPSVTRQLVDTRNLVWGKAMDYVPSALYGFARGKLTINPDVKVSPFFYRDEHGRNTARTGTWERTLTKAHIDFLRHWKIGTFDIIDGWWGIPKPDNKLSYPYQRIIDRLLTFKGHDNPLVQRLAKRMSVGCYGTSGEEWEDRYSDRFNPVWFAMTPARISLMLAHFIYQNRLQDHVAHIPVDGMILTKEVDALPPQFKYKGAYEAIITSSGSAFLSGQNNRWLKLEDLKRMIAQHPNDTYYYQEVPRILTLGQALANDDLEHMGETVTQRSSLDLFLMEKDRDFEKLPETGGDLMSHAYKSKLLTV